MSGWELTRLSLHVAAATIWLGGQLVLAALLPTLRRLSADAPALVARAYSRVAWPAFGVLLLTGAWNAWAVRHELHGTHQVVFSLKVTAAVGSGLTAWAHQRMSGSTGRALTGAATGGLALLALVLGIDLTL